MNQKAKEEWDKKQAETDKNKKQTEVLHNLQFIIFNLDDMLALLNYHAII
jgi:hypothetical protein